MTNLVKCVRCKLEKPRETAYKHSIYTSKDNVSTQRYICRDCQNARIRVYRGARPVATNISKDQEEEDIRLVSEEYVIPEGW